MTSFRVRPAGIVDIPTLAQHRAAMYRDMGELAPAEREPLIAATIASLHEVMPRGDYLAWVAEADEPPGAIIAGAGVLLRPILPRPGGADGGLERGPEALVMNVFVEPEWRRRGVADALMRTLLDALGARGIRRIVLHASDAGRPLYERLGFTPTNEMRSTRPRQD